MSKLSIGTHLKISDGFEELFLQADFVNARVIQIFLKSNRSWSGPKFDKNKINSFFKLKSKSLEVVAHAGYLINLAAAKEDILSKSIESLIDELERCDQLKIKYLVLHPGSHTSLSREEGLELLAESLNYVFQSSQNKTTMILLENMAGQGSSLGTTFEELALVFKMVKNKKRLGFCLDTCHLFAFGYEFDSSKELDRLIDNFDKACGLENLRVVHLNDSKYSFGEKKDRHENIGLGKIGLKSLERFVNHKKLSHVYFILETPEVDGYKNYKNEIALFD